MSNNLICVVYVDGCLFWECSKPNIDKFIKYFKENRSSYNWEHSKLDSVSEFLFIDTNSSNDGGF